MFSRLHLSDLLTVGHHLGVLICALGALMVIPVLVALLFGEYDCVGYYLLGIGVCFASGSCLLLLKRGHLDRRTSLLLAASAWIVLGIVAAVPLFASGDFGSFFDALFDAVSSLTTTGITLMSDVDHMAYAHVTWRALLALIGSQGVIVVALYLGFFGEGNYSARVNAQARHESLSISMARTGRYVIMIMLGVILIGTVGAALIGAALGLAPVDSILNGLWLCIGACSTSSFIPHASSLIYYHSLALNIFLCLLMLIGAFNFVSYLLAARGRIRQVLRNTEARAFSVWLAALVVVVTAVLARDGFFTTFEGMLNHATFMTISSVTTTGMQTVYPEQFGVTLADGALVILMAGALIGSASCSSSGGIKIYRVGQVLRWIFFTVKSTLLPNSVQATVRSFGSNASRRVYPKDAMLAMCVTLLYIIAAGVGAALFIAHGNPALSSLFESISYVSNAGVTTGITSASMSVDLKIVAVFQMWAGRLEFIALLALLAGIICSLVPQKSNVPNGVTATRKARRVLKRKRFAKRLLGKLKGPGSKAGSVLLVLLLGAAAFAPLGLSCAVAHADEEGEFSFLAQEASYRQVSISELLGATDRLDGKGVEFTGEAIGTALNAGGGYKWVNLLQDGDMIGVLMTSEDAALITEYGSYKAIGDTVCVKGTFNLMCDEHAGELEVHADSVEIVGYGIATQPVLDRAYLIAAALLAVAGGIFLLLHYVIYGRLPHPKLKM